MRFSITHKVCPKCKQEKCIDDYHQYFSKQRNKWRIGNYCKPCARKDAKPRAKKHFEKNKEQKLKYARDYRANPKNKNKLKALSQKFKKKYREELKDCYVRDQLNCKHGISNEFSTTNPEIVEAYRLKLKIKRKIKSLRNGKK